MSLIMVLTSFLVMMFLSGVEIVKGLIVSGLFSLLPMYRENGFKDFFEAVDSFRKYKYRYFRLSYSLL